MTNRPHASRIGQVFFRLRSLTPIPFILVLIFFSQPTPLSIVLGSLLIVLGEWLRIWAVGYAGGSTRTRTLGTARDLVTTGPYAYVRNPLYLGNLVLSLGVCVIANVHWMIVVLLIGFLIQYTPIIRSEETYLLDVCGDRYRAYCAAVSRFLPHPRPYVEPSDHDFSLRRALKSEKRTLTAIVCVLILIASQWLLR
ncbi:MAG: isoprenylcysteine carboxylmethyltransferase family protein [Candidatus Poribacteria bacterium]|nr:isoprenylcysteine carboxylmethyltransferase family protein [Candidatus Poribacteria bacterium]